jgi:ArsR family transcriptional regulator
VDERAHAGVKLVADGAADVVITMGCGDVCPVMPGKRYEDWVVGDPALASPAGARAIRDELDTRVRALVHDLLPDLPLAV